MISQIMDIETFYGTISQDTDINPFFRHAITSEYPRCLIRTFHLAAWDIFNITEIVGDTVQCNSMKTFILCAHAETGMRDPTTDKEWKTYPDERRLSDFPSVCSHLGKNWVHEGDTPICFMSMTHAVDMLEAVEWLLFSDITCGPKDMIYISQLNSLFCLVRNRICCFIQENEMSTAVLNMPRFVNVKKKGLFETVNPAIVDYASDEETRTKLKKQIQSNTTKKDYNVANVNMDFIYTMDSIITNIELEMAIHMARTNQAYTAPTVNIDLLPLRTWLQAETVTKDIENLLLARNTWQVNLQNSPSYLRIYRLDVKNMSATVKTRALISRKNAVLAIIGRASSYKDIFEAGPGSIGKVVHRMSMDAMLIFVDSQNKRIYDAVLKQYIVYNKIESTWSTTWNEVEITECSFTHAFVALRKAMKEEKVLHGVDISVYDDKLF